MHRALFLTLRILAVLAAVVLLVWGAMALMLGAFRGDELWKLAAFLLMGPLALIPAAVLARSRPRAAGLWLSGAGVASAAALITEGAPLWVFLALALPGGAVLAAVGRRPEPKLDRAALLFPGLWLAGTLAVSAGAVAMTEQSTWTLKVTRADGGMRSLRLSPRSDYGDRLRRVKEALAPVFETPGRFELTGPQRVRFEVRTAGPNQVTVHRSDRTQFPPSVERRDVALSNVAHAIGNITGRRE